MKIGTDLLILATDAMPLLGGRDHGDTNGHQHETKLFEVTYMARNNPYFDVLNEGTKEVAETDGDTLFTRDLLQDQGKQNGQIQEMIDEGIQMPLLNPADWEKVQPALGACKEAGVGTINVDMIVEDRDSVISIIEADNYQAGQLCTLDMMERKDETKIVILDNPIQASITNREQGFPDTVTDNHNYQVTYRGAMTGEVEVSSHVMAGLLRRDISFDVILGGNNPAILGTPTALQQTGREEGVSIYGVDGSPNFKAILDMGYMTEVSAQSPRSTERKAVETAYRCLDGGPVEKYMNTSSTMITRDNLHEFEMSERQWEGGYEHG